MSNHIKQASEEIYKKGVLDSLPEHLQTAIKQSLAITENQRIYTPEEKNAMRYKKAGNSFGKRFMMVNDEDGGRYQYVTMNEIGILFKLSLNLQHNQDGVLMHDTGRGQSGIRPLTTADIMKLLNRSKPATLKALSSLERIGAIERDNSQRPTVYRINEDLILYGKNKKFKNFTKVYRIELRKMMKDLSDREAGAIFMLLSCVHKDSYVLCHNPKENDPAKVDVMNAKHIAERLGLKYTTARNLISALIRKGAMITVSGRKTGVDGKGYVINPHVCDRGVPNNPHEPTIKRLYDTFASEKIDRK